MECKICSSKTSLFGSAVLLNKHRIQYFRCNSCGFLQTEEPYWFQESYSEVIARTDVGLVSRNLMFSQVTQTLISVFFDSNGKFLDYGGGYGLLVRLMRDQGFDFYWHDKWCDNLFARAFEASNAGTETFELLTAFEVFEHLSHPLGELTEMLRFSKNVLFSTELLPVHAPPLGKWPYYCLEHGQHVSFYTVSSLSALAKRLDVDLYSNGSSLHLFTKKKISPFFFRLFSLYPMARVLSCFQWRKSLLKRDYEEAVKALTVRSETIGKGDYQRT
jgi:hypothetical protein